MIIGIDLGTTNSLAAVWQNGQAVLIPNALGKYLTPSVVSVDENGMVLVGEAARDLQLVRPANCAANFKRLMGTAQTIMLGKQAFRPEELSSLVLRQLKEDAENFLGETVNEAVISVPAYFSDVQRKATKIAASMAGLTVERLINEPTAAALAYGLHNQEDEHQFLVFDLGGGTFDVSILELFDNIMEVRASAGDNFLGGEDIVDILVEAFRQQQEFMEEIEWREPTLQRQLRVEAERVKRALSLREAAVFSVEIKGQHYQWQITETDFELLLESFFARIREPLEMAIRDARLDISQLDQVVLVGGSTRMPLIRKLVAQLFGRLPAMHLNPDEVIAQGAAIQAALKARNSELEDVVVTDVCPFTLGVNTSRTLGHTREQGYFAPIIERNRSIPCSRMRKFYTVHDDQSTVDFKIYQGESRMVENNIFLAELSIAVPPKAAGEVEIEVRFTYDINGLLDVDIHVPLTGNRSSLLIEQHPGALTEEQLQQSLAKLSALKIHPRDDQANQALMARLDHLYQLSLGDTREWISDCSRQFSYLLEKQDNDPIVAFRERLNHILDDLETDRLL
ncbi:TPA: Hsp70 family protein [Klebsiella aerogenes]|uniref:molecular chaperone HscC n=1 Tax=Klebsiella TaxID=570 RepID=UPI0029293C15|nr:molecular chaperone HscC [Klebsiella sp. 141203]MDU9363643.1 molecular chaperone HscC [Klebsiella sp. 141203]HEP0585535.1 molecular chaperone HscC [Klebsiella aerogenes]